MLYDLPAPAKLNLFLHVVGRRADGYHLLQTVMRFIDLSDKLSFDLRNDGRLSCDNSLDIAPEDDLILRAAQLLQQHSGTKLGAHVVCEKQIPAGGGLGGGSSDAATTLIALNRLWQTGLSRADLLQLGAGLGADIPVFLFGQNAFAQQTGELLSAVQVPHEAYVLVQPDAFVSTAAVFDKADLTRNTEAVKIADFVAWQKSGLFGRNDLEPVVLAQYPNVRLAAGFVNQVMNQTPSGHGQGLQVRLTGSGACLFVPHADLPQACTTRQQIIAKMAQCGSRSGIRQIWACSGLPEHPLRHW